MASTRADMPVSRGDRARRAGTKTSARQREADVVINAVPAQMVGLGRVADPGTRTRAALQLQRRAGNHAVQDLLQRGPPAAAKPLTDAEQWDLDWKAHPGRHSLFDGEDRPPGTPRERYDILCPLYKDHGIRRP